VQLSKEHRTNARHFWFAKHHSQHQSGQLI
jgi:hypothetical protein